MGTFLNQFVGLLYVHVYALHQLVGINNYFDN